MIKLGDKVRDSITGFEGVVIAKTDWWQGSTRFGVDSVELHEGKPVATQWFDQPRLKLVKDTKPAVSKQTRHAAFPH